MSLAGSYPSNNQLVSGGRMINTNHRADPRLKAEASSAQSNLIKPSRTHNELHKELLLAHKRRGLVLSSRSELQQVLERRKRVQTEEEGHGRTPLEDELLRRQQKQIQSQRQSEQVDKVGEEAQLMEFVRVRENLRKIHSAIHSKAVNSSNVNSSNANSSNANSSNANSSNVNSSNANSSNANSSNVNSSNANSSNANSSNANSSNANSSMCQ